MMSSAVTDHVQGAVVVHVPSPPEAQTALAAAEELNQRRGESHEGVGEDQGHNADAANLQGQDAAPDRRTFSGRSHA